MICKISVIIMDVALASRIEQGASVPSKRMKAVKGLSQRDVFTGVLLMLVLPFLEDSVENVLEVVDAAADAGAKFVYAAFGMTLRDCQQAYYYDQLVRNFLGIKEKSTRSGTGVAAGV